MKERLAEERKRLGLSQEEFATLGGIPMRTYCGYEYGISEPKASFLTRLAANGVDVLYILTGVRSAKAELQEPPANYAVLNKKRVDKLMDDLTPEQQAEVVKVAEEKRRLNFCEIELAELKKKKG